MAAAALLIAAPVAVAAILAVMAAMAWFIRRGGSSVVGVGTRRAAPAHAWRLGALAAVVIVPTTALAYLTSTSGFVWDDIKNLRQAQVEDLSIRYLLEPTSGHFAPGHRLADWLLERLFPFNFTAAQAVMLIGFALTLVVLHRLLAELFRPGVGPLLLTLLYGASLVHVGVVQWWASGMDRVPATLFSFLAILAYVLYWRNRSWPLLAASVASLAAAELFYVKPVFVPLYLVLMRVLLLEPERPVRDTLADTAREWRVWLLYGVTVGVFAVVYLGAYPTGLNQATTPAVLAEYLGNLWFRVLVPNFFGLWVPMGGVSSVMWAAAVTAQVLFVAVVAWSVVRWRPAWRAWAFFAVGFLANAVIVGATRIGYFAAKIIAYTVYFNLEATFLFVLALGAAFLRPRSAVPAPPAARQGSVASPALLGAFGAGLVGYLALSWWGGYRISQPEVWIGARSRIYLDEATAGLRTLRRSEREFALVDGVVPDDVVPYLLVPYNSASEVFPLIDDDVSFDAERPALFDVAPNGTVRAVTFVPDVGGDVATLLQRGLLGVLGAEPRLVDGALCVGAGGEAASIGFVPPAPLSGEDLDARLTFDAGKPFRVSFVVDPRPRITSGLSKGRTKFRVVNVGPGARQTKVFALDAPTVRSVFVVVAPRSELCLRSLELGRLAARGPAGP